MSPVPAGTRTASALEHGGDKPWHGLKTARRVKWPDCPVGYGRMTIMGRIMTPDGGRLAVDLVPT
jgi:hypothetical protein